MSSPELNSTLTFSAYEKQTLKLRVTITNHSNIFILYVKAVQFSLYAHYLELDTLPSRTVTAYLEPHSIYEYCLSKK